MKILNDIVSNTLQGVVNYGQRRTGRKPSPELPKGAFVKPAVKSEFFTAGFGKAVMLPGDIGKRTYYIAGYSENNPAKGVLDPQYAHALWLDDNSGLGGILIISLDIVGLLINDVEEIQKRLEDFCRITACRSITVLSTHNHAGIDTMGIWGMLPFSGKSPKFMNILFNAVKTAAMQAYEDRKKGRLFCGSIEVPDMQEDIRLPEVYSKTLTRLRFVPNDGSREIWFLNFASHSESLQGCNNLVSADFPGYMRERIRSVTGAETIYGVGAIGGMISMKIDDEDTLRKEHRLAESTRNIGFRLADYAISISEEKPLRPSIGIIKQKFYCPVENPVLTVACQIGLLNADRYLMPGNPSKSALITQISYFEIDTLGILMVPCELFPELAYGGYLDAEHSAEGKPADINPAPLIEIAKNDRLLIFGLADDEIGYVMPPNDFMLNKESPYLERAFDRHGRKHYEETNSMGPDTASVIAGAVAGVMDTVNKAR